MQATPEELYDLRATILAAKKFTLEAQLLDLKAQGLSLEIEKKYGVLNQKASIDIQTGEITVQKDPKAKEGLES